MNMNIESYLDTYMVNPDLRYAVMLKGKWGCGKTYFITNWLKKYKEKEKANLVVLEPIYVSLYGLKYIQQLKHAFHSGDYTIESERICSVLSKSEYLLN